MLQICYALVNCNVSKKMVEKKIITYTEIPLFVMRKNVATFLGTGQL